MASCASWDCFGFLKIAGLFQGEIVAEALADELLRLGGGHLRDPHRIGAHVGDEAHRLPGPQVDALVELLGQHHGLLGGEPQLADGLLLQLARRERGRRVLADGLLLDLLHDEGRTVDFVQDLPGRRFVRYADLLLALFDELGGKRRGRVALQVGRDRPVLLGLEGLDRALALADDAHGDGLHAARTQPALDLAPQERGDLVAHQAVQYPARLLRLELVAVQLQRPGHGLFDGVFRELMEEDPVKAPALFLEHVGRMPGNGLALAVGVGGEVDVLRVRGGPLELLEHLLLAGDGRVLGREAGLHVDAHFALRQVPDVADGGGHVVSLAQVFFDGPDFCRRFHHDQRFRHEISGPRCHGVRDRSSPAATKSLPGSCVTIPFSSSCSRMPERFPGSIASRRTRSSMCTG